MFLVVIFQLSILFKWLLYKSHQVCITSVYREDSSEVRIKQSLENDAIDSKYGFDRVRDYQERTGFLINMHSVSLS